MSLGRLRRDSWHTMQFGGGGGRAPAARAILGSMSALRDVLLGPANRDGDAAQKAHFRVRDFGAIVTFMHT